MKIKSSPTLREFPNAVFLAVDIAERVADVARTDHVFIHVGAFIGEWENNDGSESCEMTVDLEDEVLCLPETSEEGHEDFVGVFRGVACWRSFINIA